MFVKHHAEEDYPTGGVVFLDQEKLTSMGVEETYAPPLLSHPLNLPPPPPPLFPLLHGKWQLHVTKLETHPAALLGLTFVKRA